MGLLILGLVLFICLVLVHEWGHFVVARRNGVEVEEFGLFFPPRIKAWKTKGGWDLSLNLLPVGGFVRLKGEHDADTSKGTFGAASLWAKVKIMMAGVGMNLLTAFVLLTALAWLGMPKLIDNQFTVNADTRVVKNDVLVGYVEPGSPAAKAGIKAQDKLYAIGGKEVAFASQLPQITKSLAGKTVDVDYERDGRRYTRPVTLLSADAVSASRNTKNPKGYLGLSPTEYTIRRSTWSAPVVAAGIIGQFTKLTFQGLGTAVAGLFQGDTQKAESQVSGPVGIFVLLKDGSVFGYQFILMVVAVISLSLAIMNVLPIPALDGGRLFVTLVARLFKKRVSENVENWVYGSGFALLILLMVLITIVDVKRF